MKAIMISIKPKYVAKILNGEKTIEIRRTMPKCDLPIDVYIYCTKEDSLSILKTYPKDTYVCEQEFKCDDFPYLCSGYEGKGKVVAKFTLNKVEEIETCERHNPELLKQSCLNAVEFYAYLTKGKNFLGQVLGYAWHISNLEIFDKPKELSEFLKPKWHCYRSGCPHFETPSCNINKCKPKAPQSWCYVEVDQPK